ncbi:zinc ABC transporter ATP-binding protein ZnuC [Alkalimarinus coralli]|uniref:zinc ABC transporter ATP-binding protein ZnuC n=1 Tax=Alkalimarinus coralli TaxID=2935863 RepID=UPI00202B95B6|nr:zinc ABC transporter ATP-binding protein ZnuC [Alkalimarinus coralli]
MTLLVEAQQISVRYNEHTAVSDVSLSINKGEIVTLIGPNGAGKTTLVRAILGLTPVSSGQLTKKPSLSIGYMPQKLQIDSTLPVTVNRFLALASRRANGIAEALRLVGVEHLGKKPIQAISGGELQRVLLARAILRKPELLVLDEPAQGVDITGQTELYALIKQIRDQLDCGVLMISHDLHLVMAATDNVICLNQHVCCSGHPETVSNDPAYQELFGDTGATQIAVYHHHHNHEHTINGEVVACQHSAPSSPAPSNTTHSNTTREHS